jgi:hypothetical protein
VKRLTVFVVLLVPVLSFTLLGCTQTGEELKLLGEKLEALQEGQESIKKELQEVKKSLQGRPSPRAAAFTDTIIDTDADPFRGEKLAKVTILDFSDYE